MDRTFVNTCWNHVWTPFRPDIGVVFLKQKSVLLHRVVSGAKEDAEKVFCPDFCALRGSDSGAGGGGRCPSLASK